MKNCNKQTAFMEFAFSANTLRNKKFSFEQIKFEFSMPNKLRTKNFLTFIHISGR